MFGHPDSTAQPEEAFEHRLIEEELALQLSLLKEQMPTSDMFPEAEETLHPHYDDDVVAVVEDVPEPSTNMFVQQGAAMMMLDEETMEAVLFCAVIAVVTLGLLQL